MATMHPQQHYWHNPCDAIQPPHNILKIIATPRATANAIIPKTMTTGNRIIIKIPKRIR
jgi:hypothetical protein